METDEDAAFPPSNEASDAVSGMTSDLEYCDLVVPSTSSTTQCEQTSSTLKRWHSLPIGMNFNYSPTPSVAAEIPEKAFKLAQLNSSLSTENSLKHTWSRLEERRPSSASSGFIMRHRYSTSAVHPFPRTSPVTIRLRDRGVEKLKREANIHRCIATDYAGEKLSITGAQLMYSMDEFTLDETGTEPVTDQRKRTQSLTEPVHILTNLLPASCSPSPTRVEKQCYSPSMQQVVRNITLSPTSSPSPTRRHYVRSLSPIALRTGLNMKRKCKRDDSDNESYAGSVAKRINYASGLATPVMMERDVARVPASLPQYLHHSLSVSSVDSESSNSTASSDFTTFSTQTNGGTGARTINVSASGFSNVLFASPSPPTTNVGDTRMIESSAIGSDT